MKNLTYVFCFLIVAGCKSTAPLPIDQSEQKKILLPFRIVAIELTDQRKDTVTTKMDLPVFAVKHQEWKITPALERDLEIEILEMISNASNPGGAPATLRFSIKEGYYKISGNARKVGEHTFFECELKISLKESEQSWIISANESSEYTGAFNATEANVKKAYRILAKNCVYKALKKSESVFNEK